MKTAEQKVFESALEVLGEAMKLKIENAELKAEVKILREIVSGKYPNQ